MGFFDNFPYTNFHELNLDWVIKSLNELKSYVENYTAVNNVSYAGIWDITKQYPQWSIVVNGENSYLSKQPVPAGIAIDNDDYWLHMADLDPRIRGIIEELARLEGEIGNTNRNLDNLKKITTEKRLVLIGDSYGVIPSGESWADKLSRKMNVARISAVGGAGFVGVNPGNRFIDLLNRCEDVANRDAVTDVVVIGGYNDMDYAQTNNTYDGIGGAIGEFAERAKILFPNAKLHLGFAGWDRGSIHRTSTTDFYFRTVIPYYQQANRFGGNWAYIEGMEFLMHSPGLFGDDNYHPNDEGAIILESAVESHLLGGGVPNILPNVTWRTTLTPSDSVSAANLRGSAVQMVGGTGRLYLDYVDVTFNKDVFIGGVVPIGTLANLPFSTQVGQSDVNYTVYVDGGTQQCALILEGFTLSFCPLTKALTSGTQISINWTTWVDTLI